MEEFTVREVSGPAEWQTACGIRHDVFIVEQKCPPEEEWDGHDEGSRQFVGYLRGLAVATARWRVTEHEGEEVAKLERFAVLAPYRGRGLGRRLVEAVMADARAAGFNRLFIHAQAHLETFYASLGFERIGEPFVEADIPHVAMRTAGRGQVSPPIPSARSDRR